MIMKQKLYNLIISYILILLILFINIGTICIINNQLDYLNFSKILNVFGVLCFIVYVFYKIIYKVKLNKIDTIIIFLSIFAYLSYLFAFDKLLALYGSYGRNEGLLVILSYYMFFLLSTLLPQKNQKIIIYIFLCSCVFQIYIGLIQTLRIISIFGYSRSNNWSMHFKFASGTHGNPNFYSTYVLMGLMYIYGKLLKNDSIPKKLIIVIAFIFFLFGLFIGDTTSCLLATFLIIIVTFLKKINRSNIKKVFIITMIVIFSIGISVYFLNSQINNRIIRTAKKNTNELIEIFNHGITQETGNYRIYVWRQTIQKIPEYFITGIGIENFSKINGGHRICVSNSKKRQCFDKAHNEYLQKLITEGIFSFICYLLLLFFIVFIYNKNKKDNDNHFYCLYLMFVAYLIQAFFNISVISVAPVFYIIMGFIVNNQKKEQSKE